MDKVAVVMLFLYIIVVAIMLWFITQKGGDIDGK